MTRDQAQTHLKMRVIALNGATVWDFSQRFKPDDRVICFGEVRLLMAGRTETASDEPAEEVVTSQSRLRGLWESVRHIDPILRAVIIVTLIATLFSTIYFSIALKKDPLTAFYFVMTTMTTVGYGDITPLDAGAVAKLAANALMVIGLGLSGIVIAFVTSALTRAQWTAMQGLRQIRTRQHVLVCGAGNVGTRVVEFLRSLGQKVVVVDTAPDNALVEQSRARTLEDCSPGDATRDSTARPVQHPPGPLRSSR